MLGTKILYVSNLVFIREETRLTDIQNKTRKDTELHIAL